eukprot:CAMPEP_0201552268 /NCGR_PEP_ID=MMETSP0173_2-20130828/14592_1 /ASSEMBLY_ACC=CAM_ASM_000268 /TAXON_ID=218659 /ORGANISM="Vexillifera sp., Strain DIVA3 564/2" /LENGTH=417 /DNA_ID=CAMNT_0047962719 /DNA_START=22 /DNA_END=1275 /DNA_ORIENTATION=+
MSGLNRNNNTKGLFNSSDNADSDYDFVNSFFNNDVVSMVHSPNNDNSDWDDVLDAEDDTDDVISSTIRQDIQSTFQQQLNQHFSPAESSPGFGGADVTPPPPAPSPQQPLSSHPIPLASQPNPQTSHHNSNISFAQRRERRSASPPAVAATNVPSRHQPLMRASQFQAAPRHSQYRAPYAMNTPPPPPPASVPQEQRLNSSNPSAITYYQHHQSPQALFGNASPNNRNPFVPVATTMNPTPFVGSSMIAGAPNPFARRRHHSNNARSCNAPSSPKRVLPRPHNQPLVQVKPEPNTQLKSQLKSIHAQLKPRNAKGRFVSSKVLASQVAALQEQLANSLAESERLKQQLSQTQQELQQLKIQVSTDEYLLPGAGGGHNKKRQRSSSMVIASPTGSPLQQQQQHHQSSLATALPILSEL